MTSALRWGGWSAPRPGRFTPGKDPVPIVQEAGQAPGPVWMGAENLAPTGIRSPDRRARSESLYRLSYPGPSVFKKILHNFEGSCILYWISYQNWFVFEIPKQMDSSFASWYDEFSKNEIQNSRRWDTGFCVAQRIHRSPLHSSFTVVRWTWNLT